MDKKREDNRGIRVEIIPGTDEAVAVDELVDDFLHGNMTGVLRSLHEPHNDELDDKQAQK